MALYIIISVILVALAGAYLVFNIFYLRVKVPENKVGILKRVGRFYGVNSNFPGISLNNNELGVIPEIYHPDQWIFKFPKWKYKFYVHDIVEISHEEIGLVIAKYGRTKSIERELCLTPECNYFRNARDFFQNEGQMGSQSTILKQGSYRINREIFEVFTTDNVALDRAGIIADQLRCLKVGEDKIGIVTTFDGKPLEGQIAGEIVTGHNKFTDATAFINNGGYRGLQEEILPSGVWAINPWFAKVDIEDMVVIPNDRVGVLISSLGKEIDSQSEVRKIISNVESSIDYYEEIKKLSKEGNLNLNDERLREFLEGSDSEKDYEKLRSLLVDDGYRGVLKRTLNTGTHAINTAIYKIELVPTNQIILEWHDRKKEEYRYDYGLHSIPVYTKDRHELKLEVTQTIRISREEAPIMTLTVGAQGEEEAEDRSTSIKNLVTKVLSSVIHNEFVAAAAAHNGIEFIDETRSEIQTAVSTKVAAGLKYHGVIGINTTFKVVELSPELQKQIDTKKAFEIKKLELEESRKLEENKIKGERELEEKRLNLQKEMMEKKIKQEKALKITELGEEKKVEEVAKEVEREKLMNEMERKLLETEGGKKIFDIIMQQDRSKAELELDIFIKRLQVEGGPEAKILLEYAKNFHKQKIVPDVIIGSTEANEKLLNNPTNPMIWQLMNRMGRYLGNPDKLEEVEKLLEETGDKDKGIESNIDPENSEEIGNSDQDQTE